LRPNLTRFRPPPTNQLVELSRKKIFAEDYESHHHHMEVLGHILIVAFAFVALYTGLGADTMGPPHGPGWATFLLWLCATVGGAAAVQCGLPSLLGELVSGIIIANVSKEGLVSGLPDSYSSSIRAVGLCIILMRSGLELDLSAIQRIGTVALRLTLLPGVSEAALVGIAGVVLCDMPVALALSMGFILAAVSPAVVVVGMFDLQQRGYGVAKGIPSLVVAAASFDDVVAISGFSMCIGLAVGHGSILQNAFHGPIELGLGLLTGTVCGYIAAATEIWDVKWKRLSIILLLGFALTFSFKSLNYTAAGAMGSLVMCVVASKHWNAGTPKWCGSALVIGADEHFAHETEASLSLVWRLFAQPLLFGVIGSALDFWTIPASTIPLSLLITAIGLMVRLPVAGLSTYGVGLTKKERLFIALSWMPKATVQAAFAGVPLDLILNSHEMQESENFEQYKEWGMQILATAVFSILLTAPAGMLVIQRLGPKWLEKNDVAGPVEGKGHDLSHTLTDSRGSAVSDMHHHPVSPHARPADNGGQHQIKIKVPIPTAPAVTPIVDDGSEDGGAAAAAGEEPKQRPSFSDRRQMSAPVDLTPTSALDRKTAFSRAAGGGGKRSLVRRTSLADAHEHEDEVTKVLHEVTDNILGTCASLEHNQTTPEHAVASIRQHIDALKHGLESRDLHMNTPARVKVVDTTSNFFKMVGAGRGANRSSLPPGAMAPNAQAAMAPRAEHRHSASEVDIVAGLAGRARSGSLDAQTESVPTELPV